MTQVVLESLTKQFPGGVTAVDALDLEIVDGEFFALLGPSGCGKTTLLRTIAGLEQATGGTIRFDDRDVTRVAPGDRDVAMVFQDYALYPHMRVVDNVAYPLKVRKVGKEERRRRAGEAADGLQLGELLERRPAQLSGGQQQRVALARAIAYEPGLFLFDEPLSNLDARLRLEARTFLKRLQRELGVTTVYVTHDQSEALALADRMAVMEAGRIRQLAPPVEVFNRPSSLFVASFIGSVPMNLLDATVDDGRLRASSFDIDLPPDAKEHVETGDDVVLGVRPEHASIARSEGAGALSEGAGTLVGDVVVTELLGTSYLVTVEHEDVTVQVIDSENHEAGARVSVALEADRVLVYRRDDGGLVGTPRLDRAAAES